MQLLLLAITGPQSSLDLKANWLSPSSAGNWVCARIFFLYRKSSASHKERGGGVSGGPGAPDRMRTRQGSCCLGWGWTLPHWSWQLSVHTKSAWPAFSVEQNIRIKNRKKIHNLYVTRNSWTKNKFYFYVIFTQLENSKNEMVKS